MIRIGLTGGIGSGKTFVCRMLQDMGFFIYDCDREAKRIMTSEQLVMRELKQLVGESVYTSDGQIDRSVMSSYLFASAEHAAAVSAIVHPAVGRDFEHFADTCPAGKGVVMESAILVESGLVPLVDKVVCVQAPLEVRLQRVRQRDGLDEESIRRRIARQMADEERLAYPFDYLLQNDGCADLSVQLQSMLRKFKLF